MWLSPDPVLEDYLPQSGEGEAGESGGILRSVNLNFYGYAGQKPVTRIDREGFVFVNDNAGGLAFAVPDVIVVPSPAANVPRPFPKMPLLMQKRSPAARVLLTASGAAARDALAALA